MHVQQEPGRSLQRLRPGPYCDVEPILVLQPAVHGHQNPADDQVPDLRKRHAHTLDEMPNSCAGVVRQVDFAAVTRTRPYKEAQSWVDV